jgi:nucleoside diphosphate kinase
MFYQITNTKKKKANQVRVASKGSIVKEIKKQGWNIADCKIVELATDLVNKKYKDSDGRSATNQAS